MNSKLFKQQKVGNAVLMGVHVLVNVVEVYHDEYTFYQYNIRGQKGSVIALPFFSYDKKHVQKFEGYLIYHDKDSYGYSEVELKKLGMETMANYSPSGMVGKLIPLPYKPISEDHVRNALDCLIEKNTKVNLSDDISL